MTKNLYMHTINGKPAVYIPGEQIVYFNKYSRVAFNEAFVRSLSTIKRQQKKSSEWREKQGFGVPLYDGYGYIRVRVK